MELNNSFFVPVGIDEAWKVLLDVPRIAPCVPGAVLETSEGNTHTGRVKLKVGPILMTYRGTVELTSVDEDKHEVTLTASGKDIKGAGTAQATGVARLAEQPDGTTLVTVDTNLGLTGKVAQFGGSVLSDVSARILDQFANNLAAEVSKPAVDETATTAETSGETSGDAPAAAVAAAPVRAEEPEPIDLLGTAGAPIAKLVAPVAVAAVVLVVLVVLLRRRRS